MSPPLITMWKSLIVYFSCLSLSYSAIIVNSEFVLTTTQRIGDTSRPVNSFGSSGIWLATDDGQNNGSGAFGDQWLITIDAIANLQQDVSTEAQAFMQWVDFSDPVLCPEGELRSDASFSLTLDWDYDTSNPNYNSNEIDLRVYAVGWDDGDLIPRVDSQNPNVGAGDEFDLRGGTRLDGKTGDAPLIIINNNSADSAFPTLTANDGFETLNVNLTQDPTDFDNFAIVLYGEAAGASFNISEISLGCDCIIPEPTTTFLLSLGLASFFSHRKR